MGYRGQGSGGWALWRGEGGPGTERVRWVCVAPVHHAGNQVQECIINSAKARIPREIMENAGSGGGIARTPGWVGWLGGFLNWGAGLGAGWGVCLLVGVGV